MIILIAVCAILLLFLIGLILNKKGLLKDDDNNFIPDVAEETFKKAKKEFRSRVKEVYKEGEDVVDSIKEVGNQIGDIPKAISGKKRPGRKPQK
jgi:beta-lactam-binding protein with PASTA domain